MTNTSIIGGNVDQDKYRFCIYQVQITKIIPLLGQALYDKIKADFESDNLTGLYETLFNDYIKPITKNEAIAQYIEISSYMLTNGGLFKHSTTNSEVVDKDEAQFLAQKYSAIAEQSILRFNDWICKNPIPEYTQSQPGEVKPQKVKLTAGWYFSGRSRGAQCNCWGSDNACVGCNGSCSNYEC